MNPTPPVRTTRATGLNLPFEGSLTSNRTSDARPIPVACVDPRARWKPARDACLGRAAHGASCRPHCCDGPGRLLAHVQAVAPVCNRGCGRDDVPVGPGEVGPAALVAGGKLEGSRRAPLDLDIIWKPPLRPGVAWQA